MAIKFTKIIRRTRPLLEPIEPRLLYSADALSAEILLAQSKATFQVEAQQDKASDSNALIHDQTIELSLKSIEEELDALNLKHASHEIVFVDSSIEDYASLINELSKTFNASNIVTLASDSSGVAQITTALQGSSQINAIHIYSHGASGSIQLGNEILNSSSLIDYQAEFKSLSNVLTDNADILFFGCDIAANDDGKALLSTISQWTKADVAASIDISGATWLGGDWDLEFVLGDVSASHNLSEHFVKSWNQSLALVTNTADSGAGSLRHAVTNATTGETINFDYSLKGSTVNLNSAITVSEDIIIDGTMDGAPGIILNGSGTLVSDHNGLTLNTGSENTQVSGLVLQNFSSAIVINTSNITIHGNYIGTSFDGSTAVANRQGITLNSGSNAVLGGSTSAERNIISGNLEHGIHASSVTAASIQGNYIGTAVNGSTALSNGGDGIRISGASDISIGGTGSLEANIIANNSGNGISVADSSSSLLSFLRNQIYNNGGLSIDLGNDGVTANDNNDSDSGANALQNFPVLQAAITNGSTSLAVLGSLQSDANQSYRIELFSAATGDASGHGEAQTYIDFTEVTTDAYGYASIYKDFATSTALGSQISATATLLNSSVAENSSELSANITASTFTAPSDIQAITSNNSGISLNTDSGNAAYLIADNGDTLFSANTAVTLEAQFSIDSPASSITTLLSYATASNKDELFLGINSSGAIVFRTSTNSGSAEVSTASSDLLDGNKHHIAVSWDSATGEVVFYVDGELLNTGSYKTGEAIDSGGNLVLAQAQTSDNLTFDDGYSFSGTLYDTRIFSDIRSADEILQNWNSALPYTEDNIIAAWQLDDFTTTGKSIEIVNGRNLIAQQASGSGFTTGNSTLKLSVEESAANGTVVAQLSASDADRALRIQQILSADSSLFYDDVTHKFYQVIDSTPVNLATATTNASSALIDGISGQLATITSDYENTLISNAISGLGVGFGGEFYLGANDATSEGEWYWQDNGTDGELFWLANENGAVANGAYANFNPVEPNNWGGTEHYAAIKEATGLWLDLSGNDSRGYIIEWDADSVLNASDDLSYSISNQSILGAFTIDNNGSLLVADNTVITYGAPSCHTVEVTVSDSNGNGNTFIKNFIVDIINTASTSSAVTGLSSGIELNSDGGNDTILVASGVTGIFESLSSITVEMQLNLSAVTNKASFFSYAYDGHTNGLLLGNLNGPLTFHVKSSNVNTGFDPSTLPLDELISIAISWDNSQGDWTLYVNGENVAEGSGHAIGKTINTGGTFVIGNDQDSLGGGYTASDVLNATVYDLRIWDTERTATEIAASYAQKIEASSLPDNLVANWQMEFDASHEVVDVINGTALAVEHVTGTGFIQSNEASDLNVDENTHNGTQVGQIIPEISEPLKDILNDGQFLEGLGDINQYAVTGTFGGWTVSGEGATPSIDLYGTASYETSSGGRVVNLDGGSASSISQTLATEAGKQYQLIFSASGDFNADDIIKDLRVSIGGDISDYQLTEPDGWAFGDTEKFETFSITFTADSASTLLTFSSLEALGSTHGPLIADIQVFELSAGISTVLNSDSGLEYDAITHKFYRYISSSAGFASSLATAQSDIINGISGQLLTISSYYENTLAIQYANEINKEVWLGASDSDTEGEWYWLDSDGNAEFQFWTGGNGGSPVNGLYTQSIALSESPTEKYIRLTITGLWADCPIHHSVASIIEWDANEVINNYSYSLSDDANGAFSIDNITGEVSVADTTKIDYEASPTLDIDVTITDVTGSSYTETLTVIINNQGGEPEQSIPIAQSIGEDNTLTFGSATSNAITISDGDASSDQLLRATLTVANGDLTLSQTTGLTFISGSNNSQSFTVDGLESDINAALEGLTYISDYNFNGSDSLTLTTSQASGLVGYYSFGDSTADNHSHDSSANDGVLFGSASIISDIDQGEVLSLNASGDYVEITGLFNEIPSLSLTGWVNFTGSSDGEFISLGDNVFITIDQSANGYGVMGSYFDGSTYNVTASNEFIAGTGWHHVAFTIDDSANTQTLYIDGQIVATTTHTTSTSYTSGATNTVIGANAASTNNQVFTGEIDEVRLYDRVLSSNDIDALAANQMIASDIISITVNPVNDAPSITNGANYNLTTITEDTSSSAASVAGILGAISHSDIDSGALSGMAIIASTGNGHWEYHDGSDWTIFGSVSSSNALLLSGSDKIRYQGDLTNGEIANITFIAWDQTTGTASSNGSPEYADTSISGGTSAFSAQSAKVTIALTDLNDSQVFLGPSLVSNGTFDTDLTGWTSIPSAHTPNVSSGELNLQRNSAISQVVNGLTIGETYFLSFQLRDSDTLYDAQLDDDSRDVNVTLTGASYDLINSDINTGNERTTAFTYEFVADSSSVTLTLSDKTSGGLGITSKLDFVSIAQTINTQSALSYTENGAAIVIDDTLTNGDIDTLTLSDATIQITSGFDTNNDQLGFTLFGDITGSYDSSTGILSLNGTATLAEYNTIFRTITFSNTSDNISTANRTITFTVNGGGTSANYTRDIAVTAINDAPVLDNSSDLMVTTITEDDNNNSGTTVADVLTSAGSTPATDPDSAALSIAIVSRANGNGQWQYSINSGSSWSMVGTVSESSALLLRGTDLVRFLPNDDNGTTKTLEFRAWDQTSGTYGNKVNISNTGGNSAFSTDTDIATITVTSVNDAPVLDDSATPTLADQIEDSAAPINGITTGSDITTLVSSSLNITDVDYSSLIGIAITQLDTSHGTWWYSTNSGANWQVTGTPSNTNTLLLKADGNTQLYFESTSANWNGTINNAITFHAWDQSDAQSNGSYIDIIASGTGTTTAYSTDTDSASLTITATNDVPTVTADSQGTTENFVLNSSVPTATDIDGTIASYALVTNVAQGSLTFNSNGTYSFNPVADFDALAVGATSNVTFTYTATDNDGATSTAETITITVTGTNDIPTVTADSKGTTENSVLNTTAPSATDIDGTISSYALITDIAQGSLTFNSNGTYSFNPGTDFDALAVGATSNVTFTYTTTDNDGATSIAETITITVTGTNDTPTVTTDSKGTTENSVLIDAFPSATDIDGTIANYALVTDVAQGTLIFNNNGTYSFNAGTDFDALAVGATSNVSFTYTATDNNGATSTAETITITVTGTNDTPTVTANNKNTNENTVLNTSVPTASDIDGTIASYALVTDVAQGSLTFNSNGTYNFNPGTDFDALAVGATSNVSFTYTATDNDGATSTAETITITVTGTNDTPTIIADNKGTTENTVLNTSVPTASDIDGTIASYALVTDVAKGSLTFNSNGSYSLNPGTSFDTLASGVTEDINFTYTATDNSGATSTEATITITVTGTNDAPGITINNLATVDEGSDLTITTDLLSSSDIDNTNHDIQWTITVPPEHGRLVLNSAPSTEITTFTQAQIVSGEVTYQHDDSQTSNDQFSFSVDDQNEDGSPALTGTFLISVNAINDAPIIMAPSHITVTEDLHSPINNIQFSDADAESSTAEITFHVINGTLSAVNSENVSVSGSNSSLVLNGSISDINHFINTDQLTYLTETHANGSTVLNITIDDLELNGESLSNSTIVTLDITAINDISTLTINSDLSVLEGATHTIESSNLFATDIEQSTTDINFILQTLPTSGALLLAGNPLNTGDSFTQSDIDHQSVSYQHDNSENFTDSFNFVINDGVSSTSTIAFEINITAVNDNAPIINMGQVFNISENSMAGDSVGSITASDSDTYIATILQDWNIDSGTGLGIFEVDGATGHLSVLDPTALDFETTNSYILSLSVSDGGFTSSVKTVLIQITNVDELPEAVNDFINATEDETVIIDQFVDNDIEGDGALTLNGFDPTSNAGATITLNENGSFNYSPAKDFSGIDSFEYSITDLSGDVSYATITVSVAAVNDAPVAVSDTLSTAEDSALLISFDTLLDNDSDADNDRLQIEIIGSPSNGTLSQQQEGFLFRPNLNAHGTDTFTYRIFDGQLYSNTVTVTITITAVNDAPTSTDAEITINEDTQYQFNESDFTFISNDSGESLTGLRISSTPNQGTLYFKGEIIKTTTLDITSDEIPQLSYSPESNANGNNYAQFNFQVFDGEHYSASITSMTIHVTAVDDAPTINIDKMYNESPSSNIISLGENLDLIDLDSEQGVQQIKITVEEGSLSLNKMPDSLISTSLNTTSITLTGSSTALNEALQQLTYQSILGSSSAKIVLTVTDVLSNNEERYGLSSSIEIVLDTYSAASPDQQNSSTIRADTTSYEKYSLENFDTNIIDNDKNLTEENNHDSTSIKKSFGLKWISNLFNIDTDKSKKSVIENSQENNDILLNHYYNSENTIDDLIKRVRTQLEDLLRSKHILDDFSDIATIESIQFNSAIESGTGQTLPTTVITFTASAITISSLLWLLRGSGLIGSLIISYPAWRNIDPLPVLMQDDEDDK